MRAMCPNLSVRFSHRVRQAVRPVTMALALVVAVMVSVLHPHVAGRRMATLGVAGSGVRLASFRLSNPAQSRSPGPDFTRDCLRTSSGYRGTVLQCDRWARININRARRSEGLSDISLRSNFTRMSNGSQLVAVTDAERTSRGLRSLAPSSSLHSRAFSAAYAETDPTGPADTTWVSNWAGYYRTPLAADYAWMYDDGIGGTNYDCTTSYTAGCWGHRDNILARFNGSMGASEVYVRGMYSATEVMVSA